MATDVGAAVQKMRVLIVDGHPIVRKALADLIALQPDLEVCGEAEDALAAARIVVQARPDVVIVGVVLKWGNGVVLVKQIAAHNPSVKMLVLSMHDESVYAERVLRAGAMGYINKSEATDRILDAIRQVLSGQIYLSGRMTDRVLQRVAGGNGLAHSSIERLSDRELEVFQMIGQAFAIRQIAAKLHRSVKTIATYRDQSRSKLNLKSSAELTHRAMAWVLSGGKPANANSRTQHVS